jgi:aminoacrylate hydrolase
MALNADEDKRLTEEEWKTAAGLAYELRGPADAPVLLMSSGLGGSGSYWQPNIRTLSARYRTLVFDHRGTGRSDRNFKGPVTISAMADDVVALMDALDIDQAHYVGHALGGIVGLSLALNQPDRIDKLIIVNGWSRLDPHISRCFDLRLAALRDGGPEAWLRAQPIFLYPANYASAHHDAFEEQLADQVADFPGTQTVQRRVAALRAFDIDIRLNEIEVPVLCIAAEDDILVPSHCSRRLAEGIANATLEVIPTGGHACNITQPAAFANIVLDWLSR